MSSSRRLPWMVFLPIDMFMFLLSCPLSNLDELPSRFLQQPQDLIDHHVAILDWATGYPMCPVERQRDHFAGRQRRRGGRLAQDQREVVDDEAALGGGGFSPCL